MRIIWMIGLLGCASRGASVPSAAESATTQPPLPTEQAASEGASVSAASQTPLGKSDSSRCVPEVSPEEVSAAASDDSWPIRGDSVGPVPAVGRLPESVLALEGKTYDELVTAPLDGLDEMQAMAAGFVNMEGYRTVRLTAADLMIELDHEGQIRALWPGKVLRTPEGTGTGSTLGQLVSAHGEYRLNQVPEPFNCSVTLPSRPGVHFAFPSCEAACSGEPASFVAVFKPYSEE